MKFTIEPDIRSRSFWSLLYHGLVTDRETETHRRGVHVLVNAPPWAQLCVPTRPSRAMASALAIM